MTCYNNNINSQLFFNTDGNISLQRRKKERKNTAAMTHNAFQWAKPPLKIVHSPCGIWTLIRYMGPPESPTQMASQPFL